mgnify:CR=1 FL=1
MTRLARERRRLVRGSRRIASLRALALLTALMVMTGGCGQWAIPSEGRTYDPRGLLEVFTQDDLGFRDDVDLASEELGGNPFGCDPGGCPP